MTEPSAFSLIILRALQSKHLYHGEVSYAEIQRRRRKNKEARQSRAKNRRG